MYVAVGVEKLTLGEDGGKGSRDPSVLAPGKFALKPAPDIMQAALQQGCSVAADCVLVGDNMTDLLAAHRAGVGTLVLVTSSAYGSATAEFVQRREVDQAWGVVSGEEAEAVFAKTLICSSLQEVIRSVADLGTALGPQT